MVKTSWARVDGFLTAFSLLLYTTSTYFEDGDRHPRLEVSLSSSLYVLEVATTSGLLWLYAQRLRASAAPLAYALTPRMLLDFVTSLPVLWDLLFNGRKHTWLRVLRVLRVLRTHSRAAELSLQPIDRQAVVIGLTLFSVIYISSCIFPLLEYGDTDAPHAPENMPLHDALYFVVITITTVGFGDITPVTTTGRLFALCMISCTFVLLPLQTSKFIELYARADRFSTAFRPDAHNPHVVVFGAVSAPTLVMLRAALLVDGATSQARSRSALFTSSWVALRLRELVAWVVERLAACGGPTAALAANAVASASTDATNALSPCASVLLVVSPTPPDAQVRRLILDQPSPRWLYWLVGSALSPMDLDSAGIEHASVALVVSEDHHGLGNASTASDELTLPDEADTRAVLDALSIRYRVPALRTVVHLARHPQAHQLRAAGVHAVLESATLADFVLGLSAHCRGVAALLLHLVQPPSCCGHTDIRHRHDDASNGGDDERRGCGQRLLQQAVPPALVGMRPRTAVMEAYSAAGALLVARAMVATGATAMTLAPLLLADQDEPLRADEQLLFIWREDGGSLQHILAAHAKSRLAYVLRPGRVSHEDGSITKHDAVSGIAPSASMRTHTSPIASSRRRGGENGGGYEQLVEDAESAAEECAPSESQKAELPKPPTVVGATREPSPPLPPEATVLLQTLGRGSEAQEPAVGMATDGPRREVTLGGWKADMRRRSSTTLPLPLASHGTIVKRGPPLGRRGSVLPGALLHARLAEDRIEEGDEGDEGGEGGSDDDDEVEDGRQDHGMADQPPPPPTRLRDHYILCGLPPRPGALRDCVAPLRTRARFGNAADCPPVLLLTPHPPPKAAWSRARHLGPIYYMRGTYSEMDDLISAGVDRANAVIIASDPGHASRGGQPLDSTPFYEDATAILTCRELDALPPVARPPMIVCQLRHASNLVFLRTTPPRNAPPLTMAAHPSPPALQRLDSIDADDGSRPMNSDVLVEELASPHVCSGRALSSSLMRAALGRLLAVPQLPELLQLLLLGGATGGCLLQLDVPDAILARDGEGRTATYADLVRHLVEGMNAVPMGLLRLKERGDDSAAAYVIAAPPPGFVLRADDRVFVLGDARGT